MTRLVFLVALNSVLLAACAMTSGTQAQMPASAINGVLVGPNQMTLYVFDKDAAGSGKSVWNGVGARSWRPLMGGAGSAASGDWSVVSRDSGDKQWAYKGRPLYYWSKDAKPGDKTGDGFLHNVWRTARP